MLKKTKLTYKGINQDVSKSKRLPEFYFDAENVRILATDSGTTGSITNEKGNTLVFSLAEGQEIIGHAVLKDYLVLFSTDNSTDKITRILLSDYSSVELFSGDLNFSKDNRIETEVYYESDDLQKVYWVDGVNQLRHINIIHELYSQSDAVMFDAVPDVVFSAVNLSSVDYGGIHTSGMIQYAYNLVKKNGSQSAISPLSELYPLNKNNKGGKVNEYVGKILNLTIDNIDTRYDIIRLYAIKYTSYNEQPSIHLIAEETIGGNSVFHYSDDGRIIRPIEADQFTFLGGTAYIPSTITSKFNRLILGNIKEQYFDISTEQYDTRSYAFPQNNTITKIKNKEDVSFSNITFDGTIIKNLVTGASIVPVHDCILEQNVLNLAIYQYNSAIYGTTGTNIDLQIVQQNISNPRNVLKSNETYRIGIEFYNAKGQCSSPKWISDIYIPQGNLNNDYNTLKVTLKNIPVLQNLGVVGWRVLRVERTDADKTILCQGIVSPMIFQDYEHKSTADITKGITYANNDLLKIPSPFMRNSTHLYETWKRKSADAVAPYINKIQHGVCISEEATTGEIDDPRQEVFRDSESGNDNSNNNNQLTFEETRLFQLFSPDIIFSDVNISENLKLRLNHNALNPIANCSEWAKQYNTDNNLLASEIKRNSTLSLYKESNIGRFSAFNQYARIGGTGDHNIQNKYQYYRNYTFGSYFSNKIYNISGSPMIADIGQSGLRYGGQSKYNFTNQLGTILADRNHQDTGDDGIISVNSVANKNISIVLENDQSLETVYSSNSFTANSNGVFELTRTLTNQYGGNTYEARSRNSYLRIGSYKILSTEDPFIQINQAGDTFVGKFRFARILNNSTSVQSSKYYEMTEIVEFPVETSVDINNRSDLSQSWDSVFMPTYDEYHSYNRVYSQQPIFNKTQATPFTFQERLVFDNRINATKVKTSGELVDSWTDLLINEELYVDGKYGSIVKIIQNNDMVYCLQEQAISALEIAPRVQTVASDGTSIELGRGAVLYNYKYINTNSGCVNPESVFKSQNSIYYIDITNKSLNRVSGMELIGLSDAHGLHSFIYNNINYNSLKYSNLVSGCFDQITNDAYFTTPGFTIAYNEQSGTFTSKYSFKPKRYIYTHFGLFTSNTGSSLWKHYTGESGKFYGVIYPCSITYIIAPEPDMDCIFNNGEFKSEVYNSVNASINNKTLTSIQCWNEHQSSALIPLTVGANIKRKFWDWNFFIPRDNVNPLQRMRGQWLYMKLYFDNNNNEKLILHDMIIGYDAVQKHY